MSKNDGEAAKSAVIRVLVEKLPAMLAYWDSRQHCVFANRAYERWFGVDPEALVGKHMSELLGPLYPVNLPHILGALRGEEQLFEREIPDPNGGPSRHSQAQYIPDVVDGVVRGFCVLVVDITRHKQAEEVLRRRERQLEAAERANAMAALAGGVAHEINNPLASVLANLDLALESFERGKRADDAPKRIEDGLREARSGAERVARIVRSMQLFARADVEKRELVDVNQVLELSIGLASNVIRYRALLVRQFDAVAPVLASPTELAQAFVSLLVNAAEALPEQTPASNEIRVTTRNEGSTVVVEVADNGPGVPEELRSRIFERSFTTNHVGEGVALGLALAQSLIVGLGGELSVASAVGGGSTYRVALPGTVREPKAPTETLGTRQIPGDSTRHGRGGLGEAPLRVLVVDDEPAVSSVLCTLLARDFDVRVVNHGPDAIAALSSKDGAQFDLVLCDLMMPEKSGVEVYAEVTRERPELADRFVFMTGGAYTARGREFLEAVEAPIIEKPFELREVRALLLEHGARLRR